MYNSFFWIAYWNLKNAILPEIAKMRICVFNNEFHNFAQKCRFANFLFAHPKTQFHDYAAKFRISEIQFRAFACRGEKWVFHARCSCNFGPYMVRGGACKSIQRCLAREGSRKVPVVCKPYFSVLVGLHTTRIGLVCHHGACGTTGTSCHFRPDGCMPTEDAMRLFHNHFGRQGLRRARVFCQEHRTNIIVDKTE